ncbi:MAG: sulfotransferase [Pseudoxanthomonas sp.]
MKMKVPFVQLPLLFDAVRLQEEVGALGAAVWRPHPQGFPGNSALPLVAADGDPGSDAVSGVMRPTPSLLRCPYLLQVLDSIGAVWGRSRLMRLSGNAEVSEHVDVDYYWRERFRVHVPITTQPEVSFLCGDAKVHMAAGECWIFDTWRMHNVVNPTGRERVHLVADTVGGEGFWMHVAAGATPERRAGGGWAPRPVAFDPLKGGVELAYERCNVPVVMAPWELREHVMFYLRETLPSPRLGELGELLTRFSRSWQAVWAAHGEAEDGRERYRQLLDAIWAQVAPLAEGMELRNGVQLSIALRRGLFNALLGRQGQALGLEAGHRAAPVPAAAAAPAAPTRARAGGAVVIERPVFIISPPRSGSTLLFETLMQAPDVFTIGDESHRLIEGVPGLAPAERGFASNRLDARQVDAHTAELLRGRFAAALRDRDGSPAAGAVRMLEKTPKNSLRVPFLLKVFPDAQFVWLHREPRQVLASMIEGWQSGNFVTYPDLPGWPGPPWSFLLVPGWQRLAGRPLAEIVAGQWQRCVSQIREDVQALPSAQLLRVDYEELVAAPQAQVERICAWAGWRWDRPLAAELPLSRYSLSPPAADKWRKHQVEIEAALARLQDEARSPGERVAG